MIELTHKHPLAVGPFLKGLCVKADLKGLTLLTEAFLKYPYENFTKIIRANTAKTADERFRLPEIIYDEHENSGAGGTCFSLTYFFESILKEVGFDCYTVMVDRSYGENTHCAMIIRLSGQKYLVDPGYCLSRPIPITDKQVEHELPHNTYIVTPSSCHPRENGDPVHSSSRDSRWSLSPQGVLRIHAFAGMTSGGGNDKTRNINYHLSTKQLGKVRSRYLLKDIPVSSSDFLRFWEASFNWPMMRHLTITRLEDDGYLYLRDDFLRHSTSNGKKQEHIKEGFDKKITAVFGISQEIVKMASNIVYNRPSFDKHVLSIVEGLRMSE